VANVHVGHQQVVAANTGVAAILHCTAMDSDAFAENIVIANGKRSGFAPILKVRGVFAKGTKLKNPIILAHLSGAFYHHMGFNSAAGAYLNFRANVRPGANRNSLSNASGGVDNGGRMYQAVTSI
jgi:hypothetical protein